jgi:hypothetical protein
VAIQAGCGAADAGPETVEVTGSVSFQGAPVPGATVLFQPTDRSGAVKPSQATTDDEGRFAMSTYVGDSQYKAGLPPGGYRVAITKLDTSRVTSTLTPPANTLPAKYASPESSGFEVQVSQGGENHFDIPLE